MAVAFLAFTTLPRVHWGQLFSSLSSIISARLQALKGSSFGNHFSAFLFSPLSSKAVKKSKKTNKRKKTPAISPQHMGFVPWPQLFQLQNQVYSPVSIVVLWEKTTNIIGPR